LKARNIAYWITTIVLAFCILSGGAAETVHYQANVEGIPNSKCLARAQVLFVPSFGVRPPAAKRRTRQRSGGQIAGEALARPTACACSAPVES
jgi:hypothetical protein